MVNVVDEVFEKSPDAMLVFSPYEDEIVMANERARRLLAFESGNPSTQAVSYLFQQDFEQLLDFTREILHRGSGWRHNLGVQTCTGVLLRCEITASLLTSTEAGLITLILRDLDEQEKRQGRAGANALHRKGLVEWRTIESVFREFERENQLILSAAGEGIYGVNAHGQTTFVNPAAERMLGWEAEDLIGKDIHGTIHHTHADGRPYAGCDCHIYASFSDGMVRHIDDEIFWCKDGRYIAVEYTSTPIFDEDRLVGAVVIFRDISERRKAEAKLRAALDEVQTLKQRLEMENAYLLEEYRSEHNYKEIVGKSTAIHHTILQVELVAPTDANVLIYGESGTGKELIARAIHESSARHDRPLIRVNCASIPRELFESEFFGHVKGAFTGAITDRTGRFELADGGTLFLDEVGEIPLELQGKLLRVLQEQQFERVGDSHTRRVDVRIIAATNRDLKKEVATKNFREDLYFRLNVFPMELAPLRDRAEDIPLLASHFLKRASKKANKTGLQFTVGDMQRMQAYSWPGNIRELINFIERTVILAHGKHLDVQLPNTPLASLTSTKKIAQMDVSAAYDVVMTEAERRRMEMENIQAALKNCNGKVFGGDGAAALLGLKPTTLASRIKRYAINRYQFK